MASSFAFNYEYTRSINFPAHRGPYLPRNRDCCAPGANFVNPRRLPGEFCNCGLCVPG
jgi:hypothetical protein